MIPFYLFGAIAVVASLLVIAQRSPIYSVLLLIASFGALSGLYVLLDAPFVAVIQIIVYAGAIMVLFLFVVMLLNAPHEETEEDLAREAGSRPRSVSSGLKVLWRGAGRLVRRGARVGAHQAGRGVGGIQRQARHVGRARSAARSSPTMRSRSR